MKTVITLSFLMMLFSQSIAQKEANIFKIRPNKGKVFVSFGWNRGYYSNSNIHFKGDDYDFTLFNVRATDRPSKFDFDLYLNPTTFTIPQTNLKVGYFFHDNFHISFNIDHMKYVVTQNQTVRISGKIANSSSHYDGNYHQDIIVLKEDFLAYEHTDGLNYVSIGVDRYDDLLKGIALENKWIEINLSEGFSTGLIIPKTNAKLLNNKRNDVFYVAGFGVATNLDLSFTLLQYFYFQIGLRGGFIHLPSVKTTASLADKATQNFWFFEHMISFGLRVKIFNYKT